MVKIGSGTKREIVPEELTNEEDMNKVERRVKSEDEKFIKNPDKLKNKK